MAAITRKLGLRNMTRVWGSLGVRCFASGEKLVDVQVDDKTGFSTVTMQRKPVNGLNLELLTELKNALVELEQNKCRGMILTSSLPTIFSGGLDLMEMYKPQPDRVKAFWTSLQDMWLQLYSTSYPTVAAINGHSPAGGCLLACSCEYRVMVGGKFSIGLNETQLGIVAPKWFMDSYRAVLGNRIAEVALTTGKLFPVEEALKVGLIDEQATDKADCIAKAEKFLARFGRIPPPARKLTKLTLRNDAISWLKDNKEYDINVFLKFVNAPEVQKGLDLYIQSLKKN